jgi:hypothetical protein
MASPCALGTVVTTVPGLSAGSSSKAYLQDMRNVAKVQRALLVAGFHLIAHGEFYPYRTECKLMLQG